MITWPGHCEVHELFTPDDVREFRDAYPGVTVLAHPEVPRRPSSTSRISPGPPPR